MHRALFSLGIALTTLFLMGGTRGAEPPLGKRKPIKVNPPANAPHLHLEVIGPKLRHLEAKVVYRLEVANTGDVEATQVALSHKIPLGLRFESASGGGKFDEKTRTIRWTWDRVPAARMQTVTVELQAMSLGNMEHEFRLEAEPGIQEKSAVTLEIQAMSPPRPQTAE